MAEMVWCQSCKKVVWAYDHQPKIDIRGLFNFMKMPSPKCGAEGNFDGWGLSGDSALQSMAVSHPGEAIYDWWSAMKVVANQEKVEWCPTGDNRWFPKKE